MFNTLNELCFLELYKKRIKRTKYEIIYTSKRPFSPVVTA